MDSMGLTLLSVLGCHSDVSTTIVQNRVGAHSVLTDWRRVSGARSCEPDPRMDGREYSALNLELRSYWQRQARVGDALYLDTDYLGSLLQAVQPWGKLPPHEQVDYVPAVPLHD